MLSDLRKCRAVGGTHDELEDADDTADCPVLLNHDASLDDAFGFMPTFHDHSIVSSAARAG